MINEDKIVSGKFVTQTIHHNSQITATKKEKCSVVALCKVFFEGVV